MSARAVSLLRLPRGRRLRAGAIDAAGTIELAGHESDAGSRRVRELLTELDLAYVSRTRARRVPVLTDSLAGFEIEGAEPILEHLFATYGGGRPLSHRLLSPFDALTSSLASAIRPRGVVRPEALGRELPPQLLTLYSFESCPFCRRVRERLHELGLDHRIETCPKRGRRRAELRERAGREQVPFLIDPNTGTKLFESRDILAYLDRTYG